MQQRKRREKIDGLGYYTYWDKNRDCGCIYCGDVATTREHIPSKTFLVKPYLLYPHVFIVITVFLLMNSIALIILKC